MTTLAFDMAINLAQPAQDGGGSRDGSAGNQLSVAASCTPSLPSPPLSRHLLVLQHDAETTERHGALYLHARGAADNGPVQIALTP